ncbi:MAG: hypothetical protein LBK53_07605 [Heliobacteriaceae bacterium]|jgi:phosphoribosylamine--glycine ligase|nr:hypothetical protein [Heliobacteriaceae bacterium]
MTDKKKVLIVGSGAKEYALVKRFLSCGAEVFAAPGNAHTEELCTCADIREDKPQELLEFALKNSINLTVASSGIAVKSDIADVFNSNGQLIFAPEAADFALSKSAGKKFMHKSNIPTPKFGIFEKQSLALDYLKTSNYPVVIRTDYEQLACPSFSIAKTFAEDLFMGNPDNIIIEDYVYGHDFTFYVITDGYYALPIASAANYKFMPESGLLTEGVGTFVPDYKVPQSVEENIMQNVLSRTPAGYRGILGINCVLKEDNKFVVLGFEPFFGEHNCEAILNLIDENLYTLFEACAAGAFADDYDCIRMSDNSSVSCMLFASYGGKPVTGLDLVEDFTVLGAEKSLTAKGKTFLLTRTAGTLSRACKNLYEDIDLIRYDGKKYCRDICRI